MTPRRFPVRALGRDTAAEGAPLVIDGQEVVEDQVLALTPAEIAADDREAEEDQDDGDR